MQVPTHHGRIFFIRGIHAHSDLQDPMSFNKLLQTHIAIAVLIVHLQQLQEKKEKEKVLTEASLSDSYIMEHSCFKLRYHNKLKASKTTYLNKSDYNSIPSSAPGTGDTAPISNQKTPNHRRPSASTVCSAVGSTRPSRCFRCRRRRASGSRTTDDPPSEGEVVSHRIFLHKNTANEIEETW